MQMYNAYSLYDRKAMIYNPPFFLATDGLATRALLDLLNDSNTTVSRHPDDYVLYCIGTYLDEKGTLTPISPLRHVADATALLPMQGRNALKEVC